MNRRLLALARGPRLPILVTILCGLLAGWLTIGQARGISLVVNDVFLNGQAWIDVRKAMLTLLGVIGLRTLLAWLMEVSATAVAVQVKNDLRQRLFARIEALGPAFTGRERSGELATAAIEGIEALDAYFSQYLPQLVLSALVPLSILIFVFPLDPLSGAVLLFTAPLIPVFMVLIGKGAQAVTTRQYETLGRLSAHFLDSLQGLTTLKVFGRSRQHVTSITEASEKFRDVTLSVLRVTFLSALALELIATLSTAIVAVEIGLRLLYGHLGFDQALFLLILAPEFYMPLRMLGLRFHAGMAGTTAARRIYEILDIKVSDETRSVSEPAPVLNAFRKIQISDLSYTHPGDSVPVLQGITLEIRRGEKIALVGPSGAGKSTLAALLLGFVQPEVGSLLVDGVPLVQIPLAAWRKMVAWVPQQPHLFHDTIAANLRIARRDASQEELELALKAACLDEFVRSLPQGIETIIGEDGLRLSGGQAQRIALGRAYLKDAPLLILDEPTASLDPQTESLLERSTHKLMQGRTVLTIAHRLQTVAGADRIVVLQEGQIVQMGTHQELSVTGGVYARMLKTLQGNFEGRHVNSQPIQADQSQALVALPAELSISNRADYPRLPKNIPAFVRLLQFLTGSSGAVALSALLGALTIGASIGLMGASSWLIATAALHPSIAELSVAIVGVRFFGIARGLLRYAERLTTHSLTFRMLARLRVWFFEKLEPLAPRRLASYRVGDLLQRIVGDVEALENFYVRVVAPPLVAIVVSLIMTMLLGWYDPRLGWTYLAFVLLLGLGLPILTNRLSQSTAAALAIQRAELRIRTVDYLQGLPDLLAFGRGDDFRQALLGVGRACGRLQQRLAQGTGISSAGGVLISNLGLWAVLAFSIPLVTSGSLEGVMLPVLALMAFASFEAIQPLPLAAQMLASSLASARRLFAIVEQDQPSSLVNLPDLVLSSSGKTDLSVCGLSFAYPGEQTQALSDLGFDLPAGRKVALVGPSGAGKSTLVNLLLRFWEAPAGSIRLSGHDLAEFPEEAVRAMFAVISQRTYLFNATIGENLRLAAPMASQAEIEQAARQAQLHAFITRLPLGYETQVGKRGLRLSGGERQRLAIARALLKPAPILLLDEPTENLDPFNAQAVLEVVFNQKQARSLLLITHALAGLEQMDEIIVLEAGRVVERGTFDSLVRKAGLFQSMWNLRGQMLEESS